MGFSVILFKSESSVIQDVGKFLTQVRSKRGSYKGSIRYVQTDRKTNSLICVINSFEIRHCCIILQMNTPKTEWIRRTKDSRL